MSNSPVEISCCGGNKPISDKKDGCCGDRSCGKGQCGCMAKRCCAVSCCVRKLLVVIIALGIIGGAYYCGVERGREQAAAATTEAAK